MQKTKIILVIIAVSLVIMATVGLTYAQIVNSQNQNSQTPNN